MSSNIDQIIEEIEDYIDNCKFQPLSNTRILVNKAEIQELIQDLRQKTPEEVKRYQKIISNKEAILADAQAKADAIISQAQLQKNELVREHQIMQQAYAQANEVVGIAQKQAQEIMDKATSDANEIRSGAVAYTDNVLRLIERTLTDSLSIFKTNFLQLSSSLQKTLDTVSANRAELVAMEEDMGAPAQPQEQPQQRAQQEQPQQEPQAAENEPQGQQ